MEKNRRTKVIVIIALVVAIVGMSVGLATFANTLTISSSATVKPAPEESVVKIYSIEQELTGDNFETVATDVSSYTSKTMGVPIVFSSSAETSASNAVIDNYNFTISNLNATFTGVGQQAIYYFIIKNEGTEAVYIDIADFEALHNASISKTCTAAEGTTQSSVDAACESINFGGTLFDLDEEENMIFIFDEITDFTGSYTIDVSDYVYFMVSIFYEGDVQADGEFTVEFDPISIDFSSVAS